MLFGFAGLGPTDKVFEPPGWVDLTKRPGHTTTEPRTGQKGWWYSWPNIGILSLGLPFIFSPNLVWWLITLFVYIYFPYDMNMFDGVDIDVVNIFEVARFQTFLRSRVVLNVTLGLGYFSYWHVTLYLLKWGKRKYNVKNNGPSKNRLFHNIWYCFIGVLVYTVYETMFVYLYATKRVLYMRDSDIFKSHSNFLPTLFWVFAVPVVRDIHFYFAHRLIHIRPLYTYIHSLHHRNIDPEPFSGLCMHPVEHLYYYSVVGLSLYIGSAVSPIVMMWNLMHCLLAPAASHSGFEDHWQSDQFHYFHHKYFECNYGVPSFPMDLWFGTIKHVDHNKKKSDDDRDDEVLRMNGEISSKQQKEEMRKSMSESSAQIDNSYLSGSFNILEALPFPTKLDHLFYWIFTLSLPFVFYDAMKASSDQSALINHKNNNSSFPCHLPALYISLGPVVAALFLVMFVSNGKNRSLFMLKWPFHKDGIVGWFGWHLVMSLLFVVYPTYDIFRRVIN